MEPQLKSLKRKLSNKKIVFITGKFNIVHPGHLRLINFARSCGDALVIGLHDDKYPDTLVSYEDRAFTLKNLSSVDYIIPVSDNIENIINILKPDFIVKGKEHELEENPEKKYVETYGGQIIFTSGASYFSSRDLIRKELDAPPKININKPLDFLSKHNSNKNFLKKILSSFKNKKICVVGDVIIDEYIYCEALGMSQEDPTIVVAPIDKHKFLGGAGIVAAHLRSLGAETHFFSIIGEDDEGDYAINALINYGVTQKIIKEKNRPTTLKQRYRTGNKTLLRINRLRNEDISLISQEKLYNAITKKLKNSDYLIFSDFNYGCLPQYLVDKLISFCITNQIPFAADSQASSQISNISRFHDANLISATELEARLSLRDQKSGLQLISTKLFDDSKAKNSILKLGAEGLIVNSNLPTHTMDKLPAFNNLPLDVAGAGDALLASSVLALSSGSTIWEAAYIGSVAAGIQISRIGNQPITIEELSKELNTK